VHPNCFLSFLEEEEEDGKDQHWEDARELKGEGTKTHRVLEDPHGVEGITVDRTHERSRLVRSYRNEGEIEPSPALTDFFERRTDWTREVDRVVVVSS